MGLDSRWVAPKKVAIEPAFVPPLRLCGGLLSGNGVGSFRGKVYHGVIEHVSGQSLYSDLDNVAVCGVADALSRTEWVELPARLKCLDGKYGEGYPVTEVEYQSLGRMFRGYAQAGYTLIADY